MNDLGRKNLRTWLQKSLANHPENDNGLVAYVEAIVGDAEGTDEDLREKWTEKLDDFLAESSGDFTNVLLSGVRSGKFDRVWRGGGGGGGVGGKENNEADSHNEIDDASGRDPTPPHEDEGGDGDPAEDFAEADAADGWVDDGRGWEDENEEEEDDAHDDDEDDDDDEDGGGRSRRSRRRARDEEEEESSQSAAAAANSKGSGTNNNNNNKRARVQDGRGGGGGRGNNQNGTGGRGGRGGQQGRGQQGRGNMAMQMQAGARGPPQPMGAGSLAMGGQGMMMGPGPGPGPMPGMGMRPGPGQWGGGMNPGRGPGGMMFPGGGFGPGDAGGPNGPNGPNGMGMGNPMGPMGGPGPGMPGGGMPPGGMPPGGMPGGGGPRGMPGGMPGGMAAGMAGGRGPGPGPGMQGGPQGGPGPGASGGGMVQGMVGGGRGMLMPGGSGPGMQQGGRGGGPSARSPGANGSMPGGPMPAGPGPGAGAGAGAGSNAPRGTGGLLPTPGVGGRGVPLLPGPGPEPRPQMARPDMAGGRGGGSLGLGRSIGPGVAGPSAGRGEGGRGVGMGMPMGMPMGGRGIGGGGRGGGPAEGGRMDNPIAGRSAQGQGPQGQIPQGQGPQRSPTAGPVNVNGGDPRAFGPSASGPPAGPRGPVTRQGDGGGMPRPGQGPGRQDVHGHGHGRPPGIVDGAQGPRTAFEGPNTRSGVGPGRGMQQGLDARQGFDNRPEMRMDARGRPDAPGLSERGRGPDAQGPREGFGGRQQPPQDGRNANASNSRSVFDRLGGPPSGEAQQDHGARRAPDAQRQHAGDAGGMRQGGGMQPGPPGQQRGTAQHAPDLRPRPGMAMQPGADTRQGPNPRPGPEIRRSPTENQGGPQRGQGMQRGPNVSGGMVMGNTHAQDGRGEGQGAWSGQRAVDMHRPGREQLGGAGRGSPAGTGGEFNGGDADRGRPPAAREHPRVEGSRGDQRGGNGSGRPGYVPDGGGRNVPPQERPGQGWAGQQGRGPDNHRQGQGQGQGHYPPQPGAQQHTAPRISPQGPAARLGAGPSGPAGNPHRGEQGRSTSEFARNGGGNGGPQQPMAVDGEGHARHQSQQQQQQQVSSFQQQSAGGGRGADRGQQGSGGRGGAPPHTGGGSLAWGGFGVVKQEAQRDHSAGQGTRSFGSDRGTAGPPAPRAGQPTQGFSSQRWGHGGDNRGLRAQAPEWKGSDRGQPHRGRHGNAATEGGGWAASAPAARTTVRCTRVPAEVGPVELSQHFVAFGKIVDMRLRNVMAEGGGRGQKEALIQFANARQAQACVASPKAVLGNRFIVVELSDVNLVDADSHYHHQDTGETAAAEEAAAAKAAAAAAQAARRKEHERVMAQASKTREVVAQQRVLVQVEERSRASAASIEAARAKRDKVQGFLRMMQEKGKPEADQAKYRTMLDTLSARVLILETAAHTGELQAQKRKMAELEAEARAIGATVPPPPNPAVLARLVGGTGRGSGADAVAGRGGRGGGRGRGRGAALASGGGRGGGAQVARSLDNRPTTVKVSGLPASAGEGDLRVHANMAGVVVAAAMLDRPGEGVVKFAERWTAEMFMSKSRSFGGIPLTMSWYTGKFPGSDSASAQRPTWQGSSGSTQIAQRPQQHQHAPVINAGRAGGSIELKLAPVQQDSHAMGPRGGSGGWGDDFGKEEGVGGGWNSSGWDGNRNDGGSGSGGRGGNGSGNGNGNGNGSAGSSPLRLPSVEGGDDDDELYRGMGS